MSEKSNPADLIKTAYRRLLADIRKSIGAILGIALSFSVITRFSYSSCPLLMLTGFPCPFCGMTRAAFSILRGRFALAFSLNPMIYPLLALGLAFAAVRYFTDRSLRCLKPFLLVFLAVLAAVYLLRMHLYFPDEWPMYYYEGNLLARIAGMLF